ncbi:MAG: CDC48 family AAA ATPase [Candidatus Nanopelagicales bacterium]
MASDASTPGGQGGVLLRVIEGLPKDAGRGIARIDPGDMSRIGVKIGDVVTVVGKREAALKVLPVYPEDRGQEIVQIDGIARENAGVGLTERVTVRRASTCEVARSLTLTLIGASRLSQARDAAYVGRLLDGMVVSAGDRVRVNLFGSRPQDFRVEATNPKGVVFIREGTRVKITGAGSTPGGEARESGGGGDLAISYEDIGGLGRTLHRIREMIELPLRFPEVFNRLGIDAPKGVLMHGPPGCGKTLIARAIAHETSAHFIHVNGPEIIHRHYGESEAHLRRIFAEAEQHAPSIVFVDEIDAIAPKRSEVQGEVEKRVVAQLLGLLDGVAARGQVVVIGATNLPDNIDPALRRPGRFDREITIPIPDRNGRREILEIHTRGMPLADDVDLERLATSTHGYVGADLQALGREAAMGALRRIIPNIDFASSNMPDEDLLALNVNAEDFATAMLEIQPSVIREFFIEIADTTWADIGGLEDAKQALREAIEWPRDHWELYSQARVSPPKGILVAGPPGCGKTLLAKAAAHEVNANFLSVKGPELISKWVGESEKAVREVFKKARQAAPCILFFDEIDVIAQKRGRGSGDNVSERMLGQILTELDGIEDLRGVTVLGATNRLDMIDAALLRPGRFDVVLELGVPDTAARRTILGIHTHPDLLADDVDLDSVAAATEGRQGAELADLAREATMSAVREIIMEGRSETDQLVVRARHFQAALETLNSRPGGSGV